MASRHLSGEELLQHIKFIKQRPELPQRGGFKEYQPDGSWLQNKRLEYFYDERRSVLLEERVQKISSLAIGEWDEQHGKILVKKSGKFWKNMGHVEDGKQFLFPEEALFLIDEGVMEVYRDGVPLSVEEAYSVLLGSKVPLEHYQAFAHLCRLGYIVQRFEKKNLATCERQIGFDVKLKSNRKKSKKRKQQTTDAVDVTSKRYKDESVNLRQCVDVPCDSDAVTSEGRVERGCWSVGLSEDRVKTADSVTNEVEIIECANNIQKEICMEMSIRENLEASSAQLLWDFDSIEFPDISKATSSEIVLKRPPSHLLPPGVEIAKPFYTITIQRDFTQKHRPTSNAVARCSSARNWAEYKKMFLNKSEMEHLASSPTGILWSGEVTPLVRPSHAVSTGSILSRLKVFGRLDPIHATESMNCEDDAHQSQIVYNVYLPDSKFRKSSPGSPSVCLCVNRQGVRSPSFVDLCWSLRKCPTGSTLMWAVVDNGDVAFYSFNGVDLPRDESFP